MLEIVASDLADGVREILLLAGTGTWQFVLVSPLVGCGSCEERDSASTSFPSSSSFTVKLGSGLMMTACKVPDAVAAAVTGVVGSGDS